MALHDWADARSPVSRRTFVARLAAVGGGFALVGTSACGGGSDGDGGIVEPPPPSGTITGLVLSLEGAALAPVTGTGAPATRRTRLSAPANLAFDF